MPAWTSSTSRITPRTSGSSSWRTRPSIRSTDKRPIDKRLAPPRSCFAPRSEMTRLRPVVGGLLAAAAISGSAPATIHSPAAATARRMSFDNRLLLNRAALNGVRRLDVAILTSDGVPGGRPAAVRRVVKQLDALGAQARKIVEAIGYV